MEARDLLTQSQTVLVSFPVQPTQQELQDAFTFIYALHKLGKTVKVEGDLGKNSKAFSRIIAQKEKTFVVSLKGLAPWISQIDYEKDKEDLKLIFKLKQGEMTPANLSLDIPSNKDLTVLVRNNEMGSSMTQFLSTSLSLLSNEDITEAKMAGIMLSRTEYFSAINTQASYIEANDFETLNTNSKILTSVIQNLSDLLKASAFLTFFASDSGTKGLLWSTQAHLQKKVLQTWNGQSKDKWTLFSIPSQSPNSLQEQVTELL